MIFVYFYRRLTSKTERYVTVTGRGYRPNIIDLGRWRYAASAVAGLILILIVVLPSIVLVYVSFITYVHVPSAKTWELLTLIITVRTSRIAARSVRCRTASFLQWRRDALHVARIRHRLDNHEDQDRRPRSDRSIDFIPWAFPAPLLPSAFCGPTSTCRCRSTGLCGFC